MKKHLSKKRVVLAAIVAVALAIGSGVAYAYWTSSGSGGLGNAASGTSQSFTAALNGAAPSNLTPDEVNQSFVVRVTNPAGFAQTLSGLVVSIANPDNSAWASGSCDKDDFAITQPVVSSTPIASLGHADFTAQIHMVNSATKNQNDCKSVNVPLYFSAS